MASSLFGKRSTRSRERSGGSGGDVVFQPVRRTLRRADQRALDDLFNYAQLHTTEAGYAAHALPMEIYLLSMLLEEHKQVAALREQITLMQSRIADLSSGA